MVPWPGTSGESDGRYQEKQPLHVELDARSIRKLPTSMTNVNASGKHHWLLAVILFGVVYLVVGVAFPNPAVANKVQFMWRLAAWLTCALAFAIHICVEHFRFRNSPHTAALHAAMGGAARAFWV